MRSTIIKGMGAYTPETPVTNDDLAKMMTTSDEWITERTGIKERRMIKNRADNTSTMAAKAARRALDMAGMTADEIDMIVFATLSPDYYFPGNGVLLQRDLGISDKEIPCLDIRAQCSGFVYGLITADQFIRTGTYRNILLIGAETHSMGLEMTDRGRNVSVLFGDGAGAAVLCTSDNDDSGLLASAMHADGRFAEELMMKCPGSHSGLHDDEDYGFGDQEIGGTFLTEKMITDGMTLPHMNGQLVFKTAVKKFPEVIMEVLTKAGYSPQDLGMLIPHQANLRIAQFVQRTLKLRDDQVFNNIQKYGNTTAASIPIALEEALRLGKIKSGDLVCLAAFGSGFTWAASLLRWE